MSKHANAVVKFPPKLDRHRFDSADVNVALQKVPEIARELSKWVPHLSDNRIQASHLESASKFKKAISHRK